MLLLTPTAPRTDTLLPSTALCRSMAQFEDERRVQSALLDRIWTVTVGAISFKMTLIAVEVVEVIEKMIKLASHPIVAMQVLTRLGSAGHVGLGFDAFCGPICHRHDVLFADLAPVRRRAAECRVGKHG